MTETTTPVVEEKTNIGPQIKYIKFRNGECVVAMIEFSDDPDNEQITLYNPFRVVNVDVQGGPPGLKLPFMVEEWLPTSIVQEQVCVVMSEDILTMVDVNDKFIQSYTKTVLKKTHLQELIRDGGLFRGDKTAGDMRMSEEEADELANEEFNEEIEKRLEEFLKNKIN